jgi:hypothetical protein
MELSDQLHASPFRLQSPLDRRLVWPQSRSDAVEKRDIPLPEIKPLSDDADNDGRRNDYDEIDYLWMKPSLYSRTSLQKSDVCAYVESGHTRLVSIV